MIAYRWHRCRVSLHFTRDVRTPRNSRARLAWTVRRPARPPEPRRSRHGRCRSFEVRTCAPSVQTASPTVQPSPGDTGDTGDSPCRGSGSAADHGGHLRQEFVPSVAPYIVLCVAAGGDPTGGASFEGVLPDALGSRYAVAGPRVWPGRTGFTALCARAASTPNRRVLRSSPAISLPFSTAWRTRSPSLPEAEPERLAEAPYLASIPE